MGDHGSEGAAVAMMARNEMQHEVEIRLSPWIDRSQPITKRIQVLMEHRDRLDCMEVPPARVAAAVAS